MVRPGRGERRGGRRRVNEPPPTESVDRPQEVLDAAEEASGSSTCGRWLDSSKSVHSAPAMRWWIWPTIKRVASS